jgi:hypothetical protein
MVGIVRSFQSQACVELALGCMAIRSARGWRAKRIRAFGFRLGRVTFQRITARAGIVNQSCDFISR